MENGWTKFYKDKTFIQSTDAIPLSWTNTSMENIISAEIVYNGICVGLNCGLGNYWYSDDYEGSLNGTKNLITRRIQFQLPSKQWLTREIRVKENAVVEYISMKRI